MLALARAVPAADRAMKDGQVGKRSSSAASFAARRSASPAWAASARSRQCGRAPSACSVVAHDPFISDRDRGRHRRRSCCRSTTLCARPDYLTLHLPSTPETRHIVQRRAICAHASPASASINTARGDLIDEAALAGAIEAGIGRRRGARRLRERAAGRLGARHDCRRWSPRHTSRRPPRRRRSSSASIPPPPSAISCATAWCETP